jgi:hypothetical protein
MQNTLFISVPSCYAAFLKYNGSLSAAQNNKARKMAKKGFVKIIFS